MSEAYKELLIKQKESFKNKIIGYAMVGCGIVCAIAGISVHPLAFIGVILFGVLSYFLYFSKMEIEYEYTYMDKELRIDRIYNASKRKSFAVLDLNKMEIAASITSDHVKSYFNRGLKMHDCSTQLPDNDELKGYLLCFPTECYCISVTDEFLKAMRTTMPNKVKV